MTHTQIQPAQVKLVRHVFWSRSSARTLCPCVSETVQQPTQARVLRAESGISDRVLARSLDKAREVKTECRRRGIAKAGDGREDTKSLFLVSENVLQ